MHLNLNHMCQLLLAFYEATGGKSLVDPDELKRLGKKPISMWRSMRGWNRAVGISNDLHSLLNLLVTLFHHFSLVRVENEWEVSFFVWIYCLS